ncbi:DMT family transporter [Cognatilysobacter lacus]|uniref:DMT family transporter n=1 Tax=Cognatilysobacter lacus TaxID=1643323 RepID=A0A5D8Z6V1_9GAMM|nr:DMT family transporter [Lysobacter lacus]TZF88404.1 DMT family transporter [Lysobacter lacus]
MSTLHRASGRTRLGLALSLVTAACWATLPVALKVTLQAVDPLTLTWFRFVVSALLTAAWLGARGQLGGFAGLGRRRWGLLAIAAVMLVGNYVFYLLGVARTSPGNAQLLIQLAPLLMAIGGILVFGERFRAAQWLGLALLAAGLGMFFRDQLVHVDARDHGNGAYLTGSLLVVVAAVVWAVYALAQKQLLVRLGSMQILGVIYVVATLLLWPFAHPTQLLRLDGVQWALLAFCALNTVVAYGAFAEALAHWEASRVSAVIALTPLLCLGVIAAVHSWWPAVLAPEPMSMLGWIGAALVVVGSSTVSLLGQRRAA